MMNQANQPAPLRAGRPADLTQLLALLPQVSKAQPPCRGSESLPGDSTVHLQWCPTSHPSAWAGAP